MKEEEKGSVKIVAVDLQAMAPLPGVIQIQVIFKVEPILYYEHLYIVNFSASIL